MLVFHQCVTNYCKFSEQKQHPFLNFSFYRLDVWHSQVFCSGSYRLKLRWARLHSYLDLQVLFSALLVFWQNSIPGSHRRTVFLIFCWLCSLSSLRYLHVLALWPSPYQFKTGVFTFFQTSRISSLTLHLFGKCSPDEVRPTQCNFSFE